MAAQSEPMACARFYFEWNNNNNLLIKSVSGVKYTVDATPSEPIGINKKGTTTQVTPTGVTLSQVTLTFVDTDDNKPLIKWYDDCHIPADEGGLKSKAASQLYPCSLVFTKQDGSEGVRYNFIDAIPTDITSSEYSSGSGNLTEVTLTFLYTSLVRA